MGLQDRDYYRDEEPGVRLGGNWSAVTTLIVINVAIWLADLFSNNHWLAENLALTGKLFQHPWDFWQLLTYGFVHDPIHWQHIVFNMIGLWVFGREVETIYGKREFYKLYISLIILAGLFNVILQNASGRQGAVIGASGGVMGLAVIFACHFPRRQMMVFPIPIPIPAAFLVAGFILFDLLGTSSEGSDVAHWAHLSGAAFGFLYYRTGWNLFRLWPNGWSVGRMRLPFGRPKFRVHRGPEDDETEEPADDYLTTGRMQKRVDELLEKISRSGESSLTGEERQFLAEASRRYQQQRRR
ncbi:MAG TPA: rhomboid family intramembrane serine protease [Pirellulales bacterium]|jgi:membrane associated rhomboid family serine protease